MTGRQYGLWRIEASSNVVTIACIVNVLLTLYALSSLGANNATGKFVMKTGPIGLEYFGWALITTAVAAGLALLIQYREAETRWGARAFACGVPVALVWLIPFNTGRGTILDPLIGL
jgi:hypothetical protein